MNKEILKLIEPYTDKTLSKGCYIENILGIEQIYKATGKGLFQVIYSKNNNKVNYIEGKDEYKILGHYDITAVLKYIKNNENVVGGKIGVGNREFSIVITNGKRYSGEFFPNKPLSLYTEQEEKELLDLLLKLKD